MSIDFHPVRTLLPKMTRAARPLRNGSQVLAALILVAGLTGCGAGDNLIEKFTGDGDSTPLAGRRESVLQPNAASSPANAIAAEPVAIPAAINNSSWAQPDGVPSHVLHNLNLARTLRRAFSANGGSGSDSYGRLTARPIVLGGRVYVLDANARVRAFSSASGKRLWGVSLVPKGKDGDGAFGGGIASDGGRIYATTAFGEVVALNAATGAEVWRKKINTPIRAAPTVSDGKVFFTTIANEVHALSTLDGTSVWRYQGTGEQASIISSASPAAAGGYVVVPTTTGDISTFRAADGAPLWTENLSSSDPTSSLGNLNDVAASPVIAGGVVFAISHSGRIAAFELSTGREVWARSLAGTQTPWISGDYLFVIVQRNNMAAISRKTGKVRWIAKLSKGVWSGPVLGGGRLLAVSSNGVVASVSPQTGQVMNRRDIGEKTYIAPVIANGTMYIYADDASLLAYR